MVALDTPALLWLGWFLMGPEVDVKVLYDTEVCNVYKSEQICR